MCFVQFFWTKCYILNMQKNKRRAYTPKERMFSTRFFSFSPGLEVQSSRRFFSTQHLARA